MFSTHMIQAQSAKDKSRYEKIIEARKEFVSEGLELSEEQEGKFWPVFDVYLSELHQIKRENRKRRVRREDLDDENAKVALQSLMQRKRDEMELQLSFYEDLMEFLSAKQILHLDYQERKFHEKVVERLRKGRKKGKG